MSLSVDARTIIESDPTLQVDAFFAFGSQLRDGSHTDAEGFPIIAVSGYVASAVDAYELLHSRVRLEEERLGSGLEVNWNNEHYVSEEQRAADEQNPHFGVVSAAEGNIVSHRWYDLGAEPSSYDWLYLPREWAVTEGLKIATDPEGSRWILPQVIGVKMLEEAAAFTVEAKAAAGMEHDRIAHNALTRIMRTRRLPTIGSRDEQEFREQYLASLPGAQAS